mgnify:CR=1 FL=1
MRSAYIFDGDTILCHRTSRGWLPVLVRWSTQDISTVSCPPDGQHNYHVGRVRLAPSLAPSHWISSDCKDHYSSDTLLEEDVSSAYAISYQYAMNHKLTLPLIDTKSSAASPRADTDSTAVFVAYRELITQLPVTFSAQLSQAIQLLRWQADTQFCSRCSAAVSIAESGERAMVCPVCFYRQYPRVQPCVITAITRPNPQTGEMQILLAHHHRYGQANKPLLYGLIAGFVEVGESLEHAVARETHEEVGIHLDNIRYIGSQPWPFPSNLMIGFRASYRSGTIVLQEDELSHAEFFDISNLPKIPSKGSIAYELIARIADEQGLSI